MEAFVEEEGKLVTHIEERRKQEEILWRQKSRVQWLREGERNTRFFHKAMIQHIQQNRIFFLKDPSDNKVVEHAYMENHGKPLPRYPVRT